MNKGQSVAVDKVIDTMEPEIQQCMIDLESKNNHKRAELIQLKLEGK